MKKLIACLMALMLLITAASAEIVTEPEEEEYTFLLNDVEISLDGLMNDIAEALGEPTSYFESESCAFQGLDKVYMYGGVVIYTYPEDGLDYVLSIYLMDDLSETQEGIYIGCTVEEVLAAYGDPHSDEEPYVYRKGDSELTFFFEDGYVSSITYTIPNSDTGDDQ